MGKMEKLFRLDKAIVNRRNVHAEVIETHSPSLNFIFGNGWGLPTGYSLLLYGAPKGGKSLISRSMIGRLHQNDPEAIAVVFDTEMRWEAQLDERQMEIYGIDWPRLQIVPVNHPADIFDVIEKEINAACQKGTKIKLIIIDSITAIIGRRGTEQESIMTMQRGDLAATLQDGLKQIIGTIRQNKIGLVLTTQIRDEQDPTEIMKRKKIKPAAAWATKHFCEYGMYVEAIDSQKGRQTLDGEDLKDLSLTVNNTDGEQIGHRIRAKMTGSTMGPKNRIAEFTVHYKDGFINQQEEIFTLGVGSGAIERPSTTSYVVGDRKWTGAKNMREAIKKEPELAKKILEEVKRRDLAGSFKGTVVESDHTESESEDSDLEES
jgi:RecA/RadA recombinase